MSNATQDVIRVVHKN